MNCRTAALLDLIADRPGLNAVELIKLTAWGHMGAAEALGMDREVAQDCMAAIADADLDDSI